VRPSDYDQSGNRIIDQQSIAGGLKHRFTYPDSSNRLRSSLDSLSIGGATTLHGYAYDASGARLADTTSGRAAQEYQFDAAGRMVGSAFSVNSMPEILLPNSCRYDADGRAVQVCGGGIVGLSGQNVVRDPGGDWWYVPTQGLDEPLLAVKRGLHAGDTTTDAIFPIVTDGRSQLVAIADSLGHIDNSNATTGFHQGPWGSSGTTSRAQTFGPARWAVDTGALGGISSFRNRQYDPGTGRWLQEDPSGLGGGVNLYQYNGNNPASFSDPFGTCPPTDRNVGD
jgi:RHS repeat-associated protein